MLDYDIVTDILHRIGEHHAKLPARVVQLVEDEVRADYGGERCYVAKRGESARAKLADRDNRICADFRRGEHVELLSRRYELSVKRIRQIVGNDLP